MQPFDATDTRRRQRQQWLMIVMAFVRCIVPTRNYLKDGPPHSATTD